VSEIERRPNQQGPKRSRFGRTTVEVQCPFCGAVVVAYVWSLAGSGKRCTCGALHTSAETIRLAT
jgi:ribosomal protein S27E